MCKIKVLQHNEYFKPLAVKAGKPGTLRSLHQFINNAPHPYAIRLYNGYFEIIESKTPQGKPYKLLNLPYFLAGKIYDYLEMFVK